MRIGLVVLVRLSERECVKERESVCVSCVWCVVVCFVSGCVCVCRFVQAGSLHYGMGQP